MSVRKQLANYVHLDMNGEDLILSSGLHMRKVANADLQHVLIAACKEWRQPGTSAEVAERLHAQLSERSRPLIAIALSILQSGPYLIESEIYKPGDRYSRHSLYFNLNGGDAREIHARLKRSKVAIIGCGGIGNFTAVPLATAGVGSLVLVDHDEIELSNLTRQIMFTEGEVGMSKVDVLKRKIEERNSETDVQALRLRINTLKDLEALPKDIDLIVLSADGVTAEMESVVFVVNKYCVEKGIPFVNVGYIEDIAVWGPFVVPGKTACQNCERQALLGTFHCADFERQVKEINHSYQSPSSSPINALAASAALTDVLRFLGGFGKVVSLGKRIGIRTDTFERIEMPFRPNPECYCQTGLAAHQARAE